MTESTDIEEKQNKSQGESQENIQSQDNIIEVTLGGILKKKREEMRMEITDISSHLRAKVEDIIAIEEDRTSEITSHIYVPGLIGSYAKFLLLDKKLIEEQIRLLRLKSNVENKKHILVNIGEDDHLAPNKNLSFHAAIIAAILILLLFPIYYHYEDKGDMIEDLDLTSQLNSILPDGR